jgi:F0F1-type ATP synthase gamma subunit|tara:strand:+ start:92 stop:400 length:309 start_codon:yes stop_codon:yes gene_type:complete
MDGTWNNYDGESFEDFLKNDELDEDVLIHGAYVNTYLVLTKQYTVEQILTAREKRGEDNIGFLFEPEKNNIFHDKTNLIQDLIDYFVEEEEYEKCAKLHKLL